MDAMVEKMYARELKEPALTRVQAGVGVIVCNSEGSILLERRSDNGYWSLPGGKVEPGETFERTAIREMEEETGLTVKVVALAGVYSDPAEGRIVTYPDNGDMRHLVDLVVQGEILGGSLRLSPESLELRFFSRHELPEQIVPPARKPIEDFFLGMKAVIA